MRRCKWRIMAINCGILAFAQAACAPRASQIMPAIMNPYAYETATCRELDDMKMKSQRDRIYAELSQDRQYDDDRTRTFGVPTPMASLFDDNQAPKTAQTKADSLVINTQLQHSGCIAFNNTGVVALPKY